MKMKPTLGSLWPGDLFYNYFGSIEFFWNHNSIALKETARRRIFIERCWLGILSQITNSWLCISKLASFACSLYSVIKVEQYVLSQHVMLAPCSGLVSWQLVRNPTSFNMIHWVAGMIASLTKHLMFQVLFLQLSNISFSSGLVSQLVVGLVFGRISGS